MPKTRPDRTAKFLDEAQILGRAEFLVTDFAAKVCAGLLTKIVVSF